MQKSRFQNNPFFVDRKAFNETDILMRSYNPSSFEDYFPFEKIMYYSLQSPHLLTSFNTIRRIFITHKTWNSWGKKKIKVAATSICPEPEVEFPLHPEHGKFMCALPFSLQNIMLSVLHTREVSCTQERNLGSLKWVSHQQTYVLFPRFTQGCHCGKVLDDSFCVDSLASTRFSARGRGREHRHCSNSCNSSF